MSSAKCDLCDDHPASVHYTEVEGDQIAKLFICQQCARDKGLIDDVEVSTELSGLEELISSVSKSGKDFEKSENRNCDECGLNYGEFEESGLLGCSQCYEHFRPLLEPLLQEYHKHPSHGLVTGLDEEPNPAERREQLEARLKEAISAEDFERAARLRDELRQLSNDGDDGDSSAANDVDFPE